jgi:hypothetical protein
LRGVSPPRTRAPQSHACSMQSLAIHFVGVQHVHAMYGSLALGVHLLCILFSFNWSSLSQRRIVLFGSAKGVECGGRRLSAVVGFSTPACAARAHLLKHTCSSNYSSSRISRLYVSSTRCTYNYCSLRISRLYVSSTRCTDNYCSLRISRLYVSSTRCTYNYCSLRISRLYVSFTRCTGLATVDHLAIQKSGGPAQPFKASLSNVCSTRCRDMVTQHRSSAGSCSTSGTTGLGFQPMT